MFSRIMCFIYSMIFGTLSFCMGYLAWNTEFVEKDPRPVFATLLALLFGWFSFLTAIDATKELK